MQTLNSTPYLFSQENTMVAAALLGLALTASTFPSCSHVHESFCGGVTWNASLPLSSAELDAAARSDYELAIGRLQRMGTPATMTRCLDSWKALQCASKFQKCSREVPAQKVCRTLCVQFAVSALPEDKTRGGAPAHTHASGTARPPLPRTAPRPRCYAAHRV